MRIAAEELRPAGEETWDLASVISNAAVSRDSRAQQGAPEPSHPAESQKRYQILRGIGGGLPVGSGMTQSE